MTTPNLLIRHKALESYLLQTAGSKAIVGGRFNSFGPEEFMWKALEFEGLQLIDFGQFQVVGTLKTDPNESCIDRAIAKLQVIARRYDLTLISIEAGDIEAGDQEKGRAFVLAAELDFVPWWAFEEHQHSNDC